jgi:hypothetical protein
MRCDALLNLLTTFIDHTKDERKIRANLSKSPLCRANLFKQHFKYSLYSLYTGSIRDHTHTHTHTHTHNPKLETRNQTQTAVLASYTHRTKPET